jgi:hypothetical protein
MRQQELDAAAHQELRKIVRSVDKKLQMHVQDGKTSQDPMLILAFTQGSTQATMEVSIEEIRRSAQSARDRAMLRERVKRTRERMHFPARPSRFFDTKAIRPGSEAFAHLRTGRR